MMFFLTPMQILDISSTACPFEAYIWYENSSSHALFHHTIANKTSRTFTISVFSRMNRYVHPKLFFLLIKQAGKKSHLISQILFCYACLDKTSWDQLWMCIFTYVFQDIFFKWHGFSSVYRRVYAWFLWTFFVLERVSGKPVLIATVRPLQTMWPFI